MIDVAVVGVSGYTGLELLKILINHPKFNIAYLAASKSTDSIVDIHPSLFGVFDAPVREANAKEIAKSAQIAFLALPHKASMGFAKNLLKLGVKVVDLSADYRLELKTYEEYYCSHTDKGHLKEAVYGLPEIYREEIKKSSLVANPGCYPTASILALLPFLDFIDENYPIFIDAKSGVTGAGKKCTESTHYISINENLSAYKPLSHRHEPEIIEKLYKKSGKKFDINFVPHLIPTSRGEMIDAYMLLKEDIDPINILKSYYKDEKFIRVFNSPVDIKSSSGTNFCDIFAKNRDKKLYINSVVDNILRGSSSQAVVNANLMFGFKESLGIPTIAYVP